MTPAHDRDIFGRAPTRHSNWDHRRGEPRTFALAWTIFLMLATLVMFSTLGAARAVSIEVYRPAVRALLVTITAGIVVLWPMTRLSQEAPRRGIGAAIARDLGIVLLPTQALIWPQTLRMLGAWPISQTAALAACQAGWAILVGGIIATALTLDTHPRSLVRGLWMLGVVALVVGVPAVQSLLGLIGTIAAPGPNAAMMLSPLLAVVELLRDRGVGGPITMFPSDWAAIALTALAGSGLWILAWTVEVARARAGA